LFSWAISNGYENLASQCLTLIPSDDHPLLVNMKDKKSESSLLHYASQNGNAICVLLLLDNGAQVDSLDCNGNTPLDQASKRG